MNQTDVTRKSPVAGLFPGHFECADLRTRKPELHLENSPQVPELAGNRIQRSIQTVEVAGIADRGLFVKQVVNAGGKGPVTVTQTGRRPADLCIGIDHAAQLVAVRTIGWEASVQV